MELIVGAIVRAHGVRGDVLVDIRTDDPAARFAPGAVLRTEPDGWLTVRAARRHGDRMLVRFAEIPDRSVAETLHGCRLLVDVPDEEPATGPDEYYDQQLTGLHVETTAGKTVGNVAAVLHHPGQDVLVVKAGSREILVPFVAAIVTAVDVPGGRVVVNPPPGLLDEADGSDSDDH